ncbi:hypothetical protein BU25DRAFT_424362 [Macroventuria anomochaeta]|uniref:Uncharacterized protein n=1 Tax=Macroventuria anomochaeta TaxID=301207 RepID=A0ACB6RQ94_9PLEO|nr:uncharacterized protein BU25DRAFT_424362 [Macroventuria anomochaeta]KAF2623959.1 hypothetical protein BU25DRAFT_424362 [Macroventuria anomochaeta]
MKRLHSLLAFVERRAKLKVKGDHCNDVVEPPATGTGYELRGCSDSLHDLSAELCVLGYDHLPMRRVYTTAASDEGGAPTVVLILQLSTVRCCRVTERLQTKPSRRPLSRHSMQNNQDRSQPSTSVLGSVCAWTSPVRLGMEDHHRHFCEAHDDEGGTIDHVQVQTWSRLADLHTNKNVEIEFTAIFDWLEATLLDDSHGPEYTYEDFERHQSIVKNPTATMLRDQWRVSTFREAFKGAERGKEEE